MPRRRPAALHRDTAVISEGFDPRLSVGSARPAVFRSSTYVFSSPESAERAFAVALGKARPTPGESVDLIYSRISHPNAEILEGHMVPLEKGARAAAAFNCGMAALSTLFLALCEPGTAVVHTDPLYGGTHHLLHDLLARFGVRPVAVAAGDTKGLVRAVKRTKGLRVVLVETPANPTLRMSDIAAAADAARSRREKPVVVVDNTFLGPVFQQPLVLGADLSLYSATKFLAGFSDMLGGVILGSDAALVATLRGARTVLGTILQPDECWLLDGRISTVALRMNRQSKNARRVVEALAGHRALERLHYPPLFEEPEQRRIYAAQCAHPGSLFSLELAGGKPAAFEFLRRLRLTRDAVSLGGVESLACHPASTTHASCTREELRACGVTDGLVRVSVGVEDWRDLVADFRQALDAI